MADSRSIIIIPARLNSTRLPRKLLLRETGMSIIEHVYRAASEARRADDVVVAVDSTELAAEVARFGGAFVMTNPEAASGTDRVAEAAEKLPFADIVVNVQGDEPEMSPAAIDLAIEMLQCYPDIPMATLATPIRCRHQLADPSCVKTVLDEHGRALYFSRSPIPMARDADSDETWDELLAAEPPQFYQHIGLYAYRRDFLRGLAALPVSPLEKLERLEQLRVLSAGYPIQVGLIDCASAGIDTSADYAAFVRRQAG